jgi:hypothetical protein
MVFVVGLSVYPWQSQNIAAQATASPGRPFQLTLHESFVTPDGTETLKAIRLQEVDAQGYWEQTRTPVGKAGGTKESYTPDGSFLSKGDERINLPAPGSARSAESHSRTAEWYTNRLDFVGTEVLAGLTAYRLRNPHGDKGEWVELAYALETGTLPIKLIHHFEDGSELRVIAVRFVSR